MSHQPPPKFYWGRPNPDFSAWSPEKASQSDMPFTTALDHSGDMTSDDGAENLPELNFRSINPDTFTEAEDYFDSWIDSLPKSPSYLLKELPGDHPTDLMMYGTDEFLDDPVPFTLGGLLNEGELNAKVTPVGNGSALSVAYTQRSGERIEYSLIPLSEEDSELVMAEKNRRMEAELTRRQEKKDRNRERFAEMAAEQGDNPRFLLRDPSVGPNQMDYLDRRTYNLDKDKVIELGLDEQDVEDYIKETVGDHLFGGEYHDNTGIYWGYKS